MTLAIHSDLLARYHFVHAFSTSAGAETMGELLCMLGLETEALFQVTQVHGANTLVVDAGSAQSDIRATEADALITHHPGMALAVRTADCVPVLLADPESGGCAAVHAGWRGAVAGVLPAAVRKLCADPGAVPSRLVAAIGPHIRVGAYEIGDEVAAELLQVADGAANVVNRDRPKAHGSLVALVRMQLRAVGLFDDAIDDVGGCTFSEPGRFFSYRREPGEVRRQLSLIQSCASRVTQ